MHSAGVKALHVEQVVDHCDNLLTTLDGRLKVFSLLRIHFAKAALTHDVDGADYGSNRIFHVVGEHENKIFLFLLQYFFLLHYLLVFEYTLHADHHVINIKRLGDIIRCSRLHALYHQVLVTVGRHHYNCGIQTAGPKAL